jgi:serine protease AprX
VARGSILAALVVVAAPLVANARIGSSGSPHVRGTYIAPKLLRLAKAHPLRKLPVIVQSSAGVGAAEHALGDSPLRTRQLGLVDAVAARISGADVAALAKTRGLVVTPDAPVVLATSSNQLWPYAADVDKLWNNPRSSPQPPAIAVVDSGIDADRKDFSQGRHSRVVTEVNLASLTPNSPGDGRGHGTFVAALAVGDGRGYGGAAPDAKLVSIDVMDDHGMARTSDVIRAAQWIIANKSRYDIGVANFSLHSAAPSSFRYDPLDKAVEKLWFAGVVVVTASGNYGLGDQPSGVTHAPGDDPFVITVGALDLKGSPNAADHVAAPWSAYGYTNDGFAKPELVAPGRYMIGPVPRTSTLALERPDQMRGRDYIELSGTSFAAPIVAGVAAEILARHPSFTPDQVKGALMLAARPDPKAASLSTGVGELDGAKAAAVTSPPNPNLGLQRFVVPDPTGDSLPVFDAVGWSSAAKTDASWNSVSWSSVGWSSAAWSLVNWSDVNWSDVNWSDVGWSDVGWSDVNWSDVAATEDAALGDVLPGGYLRPL